MTGYSVEIKEASRELTIREKIALKDYSNATPLDTALDEVDQITIYPSSYVVLSVHNEKSKQDKDYEKVVVIDNAGNKFVTGSQSFFTAFKYIFDTMAKEAPGEEYAIDVFKKASKNYSGKSFISCALAL